MVTNAILPLTLQGVCVRKRGKSILEDINAEFGETGTTIVMGPNGAGKTTLLRVLHGLDRLASGQVRWALDKKETRSRQSFVFQTPILMRRNVRENIAYPLLVQGEPKSAALNRAEFWAAEVGIVDALYTEAPFLSGGEQQKLALARALIRKPDILFLDEPTVNLDGASTRDIETILNTARAKGTRIVMTTHDLGQAKRLATEVLFLNKGKLCEFRKADEFFAGPISEPAKAYLRGDIVE